MTMLKSRRTKAQWETLIQGKSDSNLTIGQYCKHHRVTVSSFYAWRNKLKKQPAIINTPIAANHNDDWLPIKLPLTTPSTSPSTASTSAWDIELDLPGGATLRIKSA